MEAKDFLFCNSLSIICVIGAIILAVSDRGGWGWLLAMAALFAVFPTSGREES